MSAEGAITKATWAVKQLAAGMVAFLAVPAVFFAVSALEVPELGEMGYWALAVFFMTLTFGSLAFALRRQAVAVLVCGGLPAVLLSLTPLIVPGTRDARRAEGEQMLGNTKGQVRTAYASTKDPGQIRTLTGEVGQGGCGLEPEEVKGKYFHLRDEVVVTPEGATITCLPNAGQEHLGSCTLTFTWRGGEGTPQWTP